MTALATDVDFLMNAVDESGESAPPNQGVETPNLETAKQQEREKAADSRQAALDDIVNVLMPSEEAAETRDDEAAKGKDEKTDTKVEAQSVTRQPIIHNSQLLQLASSWGIGPDDAARYPTEEALLGAVALREIRFRNSAAVRSKQATGDRPDETLTDELALPEIKLDDDTDPSIKAAITALADQNKKLKTWADGKIAAQEQTIEELRAGQEQAASRETRETEAKIAQLFDEKVASWGGEFKELLGVPTQTWTKAGTKENAELVKLHGYARQRAAGYEALTGKSVTVEDLAGFLEEGRYALWPDRIKQVVRADISNGLKKQRGGVGLRPGKARATGPTEQGDEPAKAAIGDFMAEHGLDPWARRKAS